LLERGLNYTAATQDSATTAARIDRAAACWIARDHRGIAGTIAYYDVRTDLREPQWYAGPHVAFFGQFAVQPGMQSRGLGTQLLALAEHRAVLDSKLELACDTAAPAEHLICFYTRRGFRVVGHHQWPGKTYESVVLSKALEVTG